MDFGALAAGLPPSLHDDARKAFASLRRLKALAVAHDAELFYSHDKENYSRYLKAPAFYS